MTVPEGFKVTLFGRADIVQPIALPDDRGRMWAAERLSCPNWSKNGAATAS